MTQQTLISLWAPHHRSGAGQNKKTPSNVDKGVRELKAEGWATVDIYPGEIREKASPLLRKLLGKKLSILTAMPQLVKTARATDAAIYSSEIRWAFYCSILRLLGLLPNRIVIYWAGFDVDEADLKGFSKTRLYYWIALSGIDVMRVISVADLAFWKRFYPRFASKMRFHPTAVDMDYYAPFFVPASERTDRRAIVAVGNDAMRDWQLPIELARRGEKVVLLTSDKRARRLVDAIKPEEGVDLTLLPDAGHARSAEIMAQSGCILLATQYNVRFSGATTVGVAAALGIPLVLDDPYDMESYGLVAGENCEYFKRGDVEAGLAAVRKVTQVPDENTRYATSIEALKKPLDIKLWVSVLKTYIKGD